MDRDPENDVTDPYILGQPMGWLGCTIFILVMVVIPIALAIWSYWPRSGK